MSCTESLIEIVRNGWRYRVWMEYHLDAGSRVAELKNLLEEYYRARIFLFDSMAVQMLAIWLTENKFPVTALQLGPEFNGASIVYYVEWP